MRFLIDECAGRRVADYLASLGHDVVSVRAVHRGAPDVEVLQQSVDEDRVLITVDKDFGEHVFRDQLNYRGIVLLRPPDDTADAKIALLARVLSQHFDVIETSFIVASERDTRVRRRTT